MVIDLPALLNIRQELATAGKTVVFTNGCFDILHRGHVDYLQAAKALGDVLIVGVNSDASVRRLKGEYRPIVPQADRAFILAALKPVDYVILFEEDTPAELIRNIVPDVLVKGGDYPIDQIVGREIVWQHGGEVKTIPLTAGRATTNIIEKIRHIYHSTEGGRMSYFATIESLVKQGTIESVLKRGSTNKEAIKALQQLLFQLGFGNELNWDKYGADGDYGGSSTAAVKAFAAKNGISASGEVVTTTIGQKLLDRYAILDDLRHLKSAIDKGKVEAFLYRGSPHKEAVVALQTLLNELGYGEELNWDKYGADGSYGGSSTAAVKAFAAKEGFSSDGTKVTAAMAQRIVDKLSTYYGDGWEGSEVAVRSGSGDLTIKEYTRRGRQRVCISDGSVEKEFVKFKKGVYTYGNQKAIDVVNANRSQLTQLGLTDSALNVMVAVSENEGNLDAINTWDNSFMTFGMFQWTVGARNDPGELPALVKKIKDKDAAVFQTYFGQHGLDVVNTDAISGYFTLNGHKIGSASEKERFRTYEWAFYFWKSGQDPLVQMIEIQHAMSRIDTFYRAPAYKVKGYFIADLVTSEYGVGLLLDNHVNRPGYVKGCLEEALKQTGLSNPAGWGTAEERQLIEAYLKIRETYGRYPMTHASKRAAVTKKYLDNGTISDERHSFQW
ncbi:MAG: D-glycero-beta-D-manno-heptose 1-phosphate adenylyltransferase [Gemmatimonadetes bacterium]|nr:MAG: D-glycero-beta-D-manno-heptose 1-phosphate adenylyltransferase [Gemmatimonadota bacterium]